ncbi:hypothetical protein EXIGLDRAFT_725062 [Exidia glandulosa HHB12029]|uniref:PH-domain-containing protein n=1 Tax=Exidia glandulosa HHB12029 TaxID=1314781 RepID=A0A165E7G4_EXIGL|nr:hypothetical protein EXIGLDRAFT_725062 [Exidia glandulosa HHB12029]
MPDYVYAVHDFEPEHEDEINFKGGERIEVLERDDQYSDGWWQGRNAAGRTGLFPQSYTSPNPPDAPMSARTPTAATSLQPLVEADESQEGSQPEGAAVMAATMTDIQEAIDQLGIRRDDNDAGRSFSFASTKEDSEDQLSEGGDTDDHDDDGWRVDARRALAERAQREMERREAAEKSYSPRESLPPIEAEISDESDGEEEDHHLSPASDHLVSAGTPRQATYPVSTFPPPAPPSPVVEAPEPAPLRQQARTPSPIAPRRSVTPPRSDKSIPLHVRDSSTLSLPTPSSDASQSPRGSTSSQSAANLLSSPSAAATMTSLPKEPTSPLVPASQSERSSAIRTSAGIIGSLQSKANSRPGSGTATRTHSYSSAPGSSPLVQAQEAPIRDRTSTEMAAALPSPAASSIGTWGLGPSTGGPRSVTTAPSTISTALTTPVTASKPGGHPSEWSVEQVVAWLRSKGFDEGVCSKFTEHEITGDVLLDLDANLLKELDIVAFGKRMRIANAIHELNRPPSIVSSENSGRANGGAYSGFSHSQSATRQSTSSSAGAGAATGPSPLITTMLSPESPPHSGDLAATPDRQRSRPDSEPSMTMTTSGGVDHHSQHSNGSLVGLGFNSPDKSSLKGRPAMLNLSPSDSALKARAALADQILEEMNEDKDKDRVEDTREVMSEGETAEGLEQRTNKRRKASNSSDPPMSATTAASVAFSNKSGDSGHKAKRSVDVGPKAEHSGRLSFFGGTLGGKARKPPPRIASVDGSVDAAPSTPLVTEKNRTLSRLHFGSSSKRPQSKSGSMMDNASTSPKELTPATLRKRTVSATDSNASTRGKVNLKPGMSIVDQIGEADYAGWMRKRGERYNTWKLRYFVLKGPHLYYLRSRNETKLKGYINIIGYKVVADENANPGRYGFRIVHDTDKSHYFSSEEQMVVREWMKAIMKATIDRDYTRPVISSCNIPTIPLTIAQAMNPAPRPPSPGARDATQRAMRRENPNQLSTRDARVLMGLPSADGGHVNEHKRLESFFDDTASTGRDALTPPHSPTAPPRPKRENRRPSSRVVTDPATAEDSELIRWVNSHLPDALHVNDLSTSLSTGLVLFRLAESIKGRPSGVPDSVFPSGPTDDRLEGLFKLFDFLLDNDVKTGSVSINDVRQGRRDKIVQLVRSLKGWEDKRLAIAKSVGVGAVAVGQWVS